MSKHRACNEAHKRDVVMFELRLEKANATINELLVKLASAEAQRDKASEHRQAAEDKLASAIKLFSEKYDEMKKIIYTVKAARNE